MPSVSATCPDCGALISSSADGLCMACLLGEGACLALTKTVEPTLPRPFGDYELLEEIGHGGMGRVFRARQRRLEREVAVKVLASGGLASRDFTQRFHTEALAAASLDHPNIVSVHEAGEVDGQFFSAMRLVRGGSLAQHLIQKREHFTPGRAVAFTEKLARAVHYAHQRGVLHRDIKPGNVLLDAQGEPHLTDFGLARLLESDSSLTGTQAMLGTPSYMSPEQAMGTTVTTGADVYGLGAVFYELLTGLPPFSGSTTMETVRLLLEKEPRKPTTIRPALERDLETICMKCLEKDPGKRYGSAEALADDLARWQNHEPITARPPSGVYRLRKAWQRNKLAFTAAVGAAAALLLGSAVSSWQALVATKAQKTAEQAQMVAETARHQESQIRLAAERQLYAAKMNLALQAWEQNNLGRVRQLLDETSHFPGRGFEWDFWSRQLNLALTSIGPKQGRVFSASFSPDGRWIATGSLHAMASLWDAETGQRLRDFPENNTVVKEVIFTPDGRWLIMGSEDRTVKLWDVASGSKERTFVGHEGQVLSVAVSPDGQRVVSGGQDRTAKIWDIADGKERLSLLGHNDYVEGVNFSPDGGRVVTAGRDHTARVWDATSGHELLLLQGHTGTVRWAEFSPDGKRILTASWDQTARIWDAETGRQVRVLHADRQVHTPGLYIPKMALWGAGFSPDGRRAATGCSDGTATVWDVESGQALFTIKGHEHWIFSTRFSPDGRRLVTSSGDGTAKVWDVTSNRQHLQFTGHRAAVRAVAFSSSGQRAISGGLDGSARIWDSATGREEFALTGHLAGVRSPRLTAEGFPALENARATGIGAILAVDFSPDEKRAATSGDDHAVRLWDLATRKEIRAFEAHTENVVSVDFSPDGKRLASASWDRTAKVWDTETGRVICSVTCKEVIDAVAFSPDGQRIATGSREAVAQVWDAKDGRLLATLLGHGSWVLAVAWSQDGQRVVTGSEDQTAKIWDVSLIGQSTFLQASQSLLGHGGVVVTGVAFSPDGKRVVTCGLDHTARLWDADTGLQLLTLQGHSDGVSSVVFSSDSQHILTGSHDGTARVWSAPAAR